MQQQTTRNTNTVPARFSGLDASEFQAIMAAEETGEVPLRRALKAEAVPPSVDPVVRKGTAKPAASQTPALELGAVPEEEMPEIPTDLRHLAAMSDGFAFAGGLQPDSGANDFSMGTGEEQFDAIFRAGESAGAEA